MKSDLVGVEAAVPGGPIHLPLRVEAEVLRDSILAVSGKLNPKRFGPPVPAAEVNFYYAFIGVALVGGMIYLCWFVSLLRVIV